MEPQTAEDYIIIIINYIVIRSYIILLLLE